MHPSVVRDGARQEEWLTLNHTGEAIHALTLDCEVLGSEGQVFQSLLQTALQEHDTFFGK